MKLFKKNIIISFFLCSALQALAQGSANTDAQTQSNFMTDNGKIFVVMAVVIVIVLGLFIYLFNLDKKVSRLEKNKE